MPEPHPTPQIPDRADVDERLGVTFRLYMDLIAGYFRRLSNGGDEVLCALVTAPYTYADLSATSLAHIRRMAVLRFMDRGDDPNIDQATRDDLLQAGNNYVFTEGCTSRWNDARLDLDSLLAQTAPEG